MMKRLVRGAQWSEEYGAHPGTVPMLILIGAGAVTAGWPGGLLTTAAAVPLWLMGCWGRGT